MSLNPISQKQMTNNPRNRVLSPFIQGIQPPPQPPQLQQLSQLQPQLQPIQSSSSRVSRLSPIFHKTQPMSKQDSTFVAVPVSSSTSASSCPIPLNANVVSDPSTQSKTQILRNNPTTYGLVINSELDLPELEIMTQSLFLYTTEQLEKEAVVEVVNSDDSGSGSVNDTAMGATNENESCPTCFRTGLSCPGHFGYIKLHAPIYHPLFMTQLVSVLTSVCNSCGSLLIEDTTELSKYPSDIRLKMFEEKSKSQTCRRPQCQKNPIYLPSKVNATHKIIYTLEKNKPSFVKPIEGDDSVEKILLAISQQDAEKLGFLNGSHPSSLIIRRIPVIPPCNRPDRLVNGVYRSDPITEAYKNLIQKNNRLASMINNPRDELSRSTLTDDIFNTYSDMLKKNNKALMSRRGPTENLNNLINGKFGRLRRFLQSARVNFSARTVLRGDPTLKFGQISVPKKMARNLAVIVRVNHINIHEVYALMKAGKIVSILKRNRWTNINDKNKDSITKSIKIGTIVWRELMNGDYLIFNRQPTIHRFGMMGYEVVLSDTLTIGLYVGVNTAHNADYDGDEGTLHAVQSWDAMSEVRSVMNVKDCIINSQFSTPLVSIFFDNLTAATILTSNHKKGELGGVMLQGEIIMSPSTFYGCIAEMVQSTDVATLNERLDKYKVPRFSGRALFSALLPADLDYNSGGVIIREGILVSGTITKDHIGSSTKSLVQVLWKDYGKNRTIEFLTNTPFVLNKWLTNYGFSIGLRDCYVLNEASRKKISEEYARVLLSIQSLGMRLDNPLEVQYQETQVIGYLNSVRELAYREAKNILSPTNSFSIMSVSGAKGSLSSIGSISTMVGQALIQGQRMPLTNNYRCLPYFTENEIDPRSRGFCVNSFISGLDPVEYFFHMGVSRQGIMDVALKTADIGYIHRRLNKAIGEDVKSQYNYSVRDQNNFIIQTIYGNDGFDPQHLERVSVNDVPVLTFININRIAQQINNRYGFTNTNISTSNPITEMTIPNQEMEHEFDFVVSDEEEDENSVESPFE